MESELLTRVFRRLFSHHVCSKLRTHAPGRRPNLNASQRRWYKSPTEDDTIDDFDARRESDWKQRSEMFPPDKMKDYEKYPMVSFEQLKQRRERQKRVKMLTRDFIEGRFPCQIAGSD